MADPELVKILQQGSEVWNCWRKQQPEDMSIDLSGVDLSESNLQGVNLRRANLYDANLRETYLHQAHSGPLRVAAPANRPGLSGPGPRRSTRADGLSTGRSAHRARSLWTARGGPVRGRLALPAFVPTLAGPRVPRRERDS